MPLFRASNYVDFNAGTVQLAPMTLMEQLSTTTPWDLPNKIKVFECRVEVWQLAVAARILKNIEEHKPPSTWCHAAYGLISVVFSYFEMIGKSLNPDSVKNYRPSIDFNWGFCDVYQQYKSPNGCYKDTDVPEVKQYRNRIRNGIYHLAFTKEDLLIHDDPSSPKDFEVREKTDRSDPSKTVQIYYMNPHLVTRTIIDHFPTFISRLRNQDQEYKGLQQRFEKFFDDYHRI